MKPKPTLIGTWRTTDDWWQHDDRTDRYYRAGTETVTLTFTKTRWIEVRTGVWADGMEGDTGQESGTWTKSDSTVTRIWDDNHDNDDETPRVERGVSKDYYLQGETGNVLYMHSFGDPSETTEFKRYERIENPLPLSSLTGVWTTGANDDGEVKTITINADGTFRYVETTPDNPDGYVLTAKWTLDVGNYFLNLTDPTETNGEIIMADRIAFAPTDKSPAEIAVSHATLHRANRPGDRHDMLCLWRLALTCSSVTWGEGAAGEMNWRGATDRRSPDCVRRREESATIADEPERGLFGRFAVTICDRGSSAACATPGEL